MSTSRPCSIFAQSPVDGPKIIPFDALLPNPGLVQAIISPPYDVIESAEAGRYAEGNPYSFLHITRSEIDLPEGTNPYDEKVYTKARDNLALFIEKGFLVRDKPSFYIYKETTDGHSQTGIVCAVSVDGYDSGWIKRHENVREEKVADRARHSYTIEAHSEPVFLVHRSCKEVSKILSEETNGRPLYDVTDRDGVRHILWRSGRPSEITSVFEKFDTLYIADGHHRSASASRVRRMKREENPGHNGGERYNFFPAVVFAEEEVRIFEYNWAGNPKKRPLSRYSIADIMACADRDETMPPKSTWFAPKLASGLFVYTFKKISGVIT